MGAKRKYHTFLFARFYLIYLQFLLITREWGNSFNSLDFKKLYSNYRFTEKAHAE